MELKETIEVLKNTLKDVKFEDACEVLKGLQQDNIRCVGCRDVSVDYPMIDVDIDTGKLVNKDVVDYTFTVTKIQNYVKYPKEYMSIGKDMLLSHYVEVINQLGELSMIEVDFSTL